MPDDPIEKAGGKPNPEERLRELFDQIDREEGQVPQAMEPSLDAEKPFDAEAPSTSVDSAFHFDSLGSSDEDLGEENLSEEEKQLRAFDERLKAVRETRMPEPPEWNFQRPKIPGKNKVEENNYMGMGVGISIAYTLVGCTLAGWGIGKLIDMRSGGSLGQAIGTLAGAVIGLVAAIATIVRAQNKPGQ